MPPSKVTHGQRQPSAIQPGLQSIEGFYRAREHWIFPLLVLGHVILVPWLLYAIDSAVWSWFVGICGLIFWATSVEHTFELRVRRERIMARLALVFAPVIFVWIILTGPFAPLPIPYTSWQLVPIWVAFFGGIPLSLAWSNNERIRLRVRMFREVLAWDPEAVDLRGVDAPPETATTDGEVTEIDLVPKVAGAWTLKQLRARIPRLAARWGVAEGKIKIIAKERKRGRPFQARLIIDESENPPEATVYRLPVAPTDVRDPFSAGTMVGTSADFLSELYRKGHGAVDGLCGGIRGSGKTKDRQLRAGFGVTSFNCLDPWIADLKPGSPNWRDWAGLSDWYATTPEGFRDMLRVAWAVAFSPRRTETEAHDPGGLDPDGVYRGDPYVLILLDECAIAFNKDAMAVTITARDRMEADRAADEITAATKQLAQISRSTGQGLWFSTVRLDFTSFGRDPSIRAFVSSGEKGGYRTDRRGDAMFLFATDDAPDLTTIPQDAPGTAWYTSYRYPDPVQARAHAFITNLDDPSCPPGMDTNHVDQLYAFKARFPQSSPRFTDETLATIREHVGSLYDDRVRYDRAGNPVTMGPVVTDDDTGEILQGPTPVPDLPPEAPQQPAAAPAAPAPAGRTLRCPKCRGADITATIPDPELPTTDATFECHSCHQYSTWSEIVVAAGPDYFNGRDGHIPGPIATEDAPDIGEPDPEPDLAPVRIIQRAESARHSRQMVWDALNTLGRWAKGPEVAKLLGKDPETIRVRMKELRSQGRVDADGRNRAARYRAVGDPDEPVT